MERDVKIINERFRHILKLLHHTPSQFADAMGIPRATISHILSGRNKPSLDFIEKLHERFPHINIQWLLFGELPIFLHEKTETPCQRPSFPVEVFEQLHGKRIDKIIILYEDQTFELFYAQTAGSQKPKRND